jgi:hypothetical protein
MNTTSARQPRRLHFLPQTRVGWYAVSSSIAFALTAAVSSAVTAATGGSPWLASFTIPLGLSALGAGAFAFVALVRRGDRALALALPVLLALAAVIFVAGELVSPH